MSKSQHVVVLGLMGVGKTTAGTALAAALGRPLSDSDHELVSFVGDSGARIADRLGVPALHQIERGLLFMALARSEPHIITAAASVVEDAEVRRLLGDLPVIEVVADLETIHERQKAGDHRREMSRAELQQLADRRAPLFAEVADLTVDGTQPIDEITNQITTFLSQLEVAT